MKTVNFDDLDAVCGNRRQANRDAGRAVRQPDVAFTRRIARTMIRQVIADQPRLGNVRAFRLQLEQREILFLVQRVAMSEQLQVAQIPAGRVYFSDQHIGLHADPFAVLQFPAAHAGNRWGNSGRTGQRLRRRRHRCRRRAARWHARGRHCPRRMRVLLPRVHQKKHREREQHEQD